MPRRLRICVAWAALAAWAAASGLTWDLLQVVAWVNMSAENARTMSTGAAVAKTMTDAACPLCVAAAEGRAKSDNSPLAKQDPAKSKAKSDAVLPFIGWACLDLSVVLVDEGVRQPCPCLAEEVPVPPPKLLV